MSVSKSGHRGRGVHFVLILKASRDNPVTTEVRTRPNPSGHQSRAVLFLLLTASVSLQRRLLTSKRESELEVNMADITKRDYRLDDDTLLSAWGFSSSSCAKCGTPNSELEGLLIQCGTNQVDVLVNEDPTHAFSLSYSRFVFRKV
jgi:hypothetical protein